jgi:single-stranded DNA-binding protein
MGSGVRTYLILEGPILGEPKLKETKTGQPVCNLGFPLDTSEQAGMEHKDYWLQSISFGGLAEIIGKLPKGTQVHLEGHLNANRWLGDGGVEKATAHFIVEKGGELQALGQPVVFWVIPKKKKEEKPVVKAPAAAPVTPAIEVNKQQRLEEARRYLVEHEQAGRLDKIPIPDDDNNEAAGPGVAGP